MGQRQVSFGHADWQISKALECGKHIDGLVQERDNSSVLAMELRLSCINPWILWKDDEYVCWEYSGTSTQITPKGGLKWKVVSHEG